jgi:hypothetical protein
MQEGTPISNYVQNDAMGGEDIRKQLAHLGVDALLKMVMEALEIKINSDSIQ